MNQPPDRSTPTQAEQKSAERKAKWFWVSLVVVLLGLQLAIGGVALMLATGDASAAIVPNYHQAALNWDQTHRERTAADRLGWAVELSVSDIADRRGMRAIDLQIMDRHGVYINDLNVSATVYHHARAAEIESVTLDQVGDGRYRTLAAMPNGGLWQVDLNIQQIDERITVQREFEL